MDILMQKKFLVRIVILLTVLNLSFLGLFVWKDFIRKPPRENNRNNPNLPQNRNNPNNGREQPNSRDIFEILKRELNLSKEQVDQIRNLRSVFSETERMLSDAIKSEKDSMNILMFNKETNDEVVKSLARRVAENDYKMELLRYEQAQKLKSICTPSQQEKFEGLVLEIRDFFRTENQPKKRP
jgi:Spy/CpxP family protein refolding chaperone